MMRSFANDRSGAAAVEMALIAPLLVMLMLGVAEGSYMMWSEHVIVKAVRDGARYAARQPYSKICPSLDSTTQNNIKLLTRTGQLASATAASRIPYWTDSGVTVTSKCSGTGVTGGIYTNLPTGGASVTVTANTAYPSLFKRFGLNKAAISMNLKASDSAPFIGI